MSLSAAVLTVTGTEFGGAFDWPVDEHLQGTLCVVPDQCHEVGCPAAVGIYSLFKGVEGVEGVG